MPWWCSCQGCLAQSLRSENRFLAWAPSPLNNTLKISWFKSERKGLGKIEKSRWCCGARSLKGEDRFPAGPRALLRWFQSGRNRLGRMKKVWLFSNWHGGLMVKVVVHQGQRPRGRGLIPSWAKSTFKLVSEWKKPIMEVVTVLRNLTSSC